MCPDDPYSRLLTVAAQHAARALVDLEPLRAADAHIAHAYAEVHDLIADLALLHMVTPRPTREA